MKLRPLAALAVLLAVQPAAGTLPAQEPAPPVVAPVRPARRDLVKDAALMCAGCHGLGLRGGQAPSLVDDQWTYGGDDESITRSIRDGRPGAGMQAWREVFSDPEIRALVIYLREMGVQWQRERNESAQPWRNDRVIHSEQQAFRVEEVVGGLETPWSIAFLPDGRMLVAEKPGRLRLVDHGRLLPAISAVPPVWFKGQGGLLGIAVHPDYSAEGNGWIYLSLSDPGPDNTSMTKVIRGRLRDGALADQQTLYQARPEHYIKRSTDHFGCRLVFDGQGHFFFTIGERGQGPMAQDISRPNGKVHRIWDDGRIPADNPFVGRERAIPSIWSYGHRNPQGLARHPVTGELYAAEHGPRGGDELNWVRPGLNYGWPVTTFGMNYDGTAITDQTAPAGMEPPLTHWTPSIAVCAIAFYTGDKFPGWRNHLFVTALAQEELRRVELDATTHAVTHQEVLFRGMGRVRDVVCGPDGYLYIALNNGQNNSTDRIVRLVPAP
jgi:glucose/arabinose dehydrogenase